MKRDVDASPATGVEVVWGLLNPMADERPAKLQHETDLTVSPIGCAANAVLDEHFDPNTSLSWSVAS